MAATEQIMGVNEFGQAHTNLTKFPNPCTLVEKGRLESVRMNFLKLYEIIPAQAEYLLEKRLGVSRE